LLLLIGGTGFLGSPVIELMMARQYPIRLLTRGAGDWRVSNLSQYRKRGINVVVGSLENDDVLEKALDGVSAIINISGSFRLNSDGSRASSYEYLNIELVEKLTRLALAKGIQRFVQVSCLGAREGSGSEYLASKFAGDELVRQSKLYWTILRPSYMFGARFPYVEMIKPLVTFKPVLPVVGSGLNILMPVHVDEVAKCVVDCIYMKETVGKVLDIVGPQEYSLVEMLESIREEFGLSGATMTIPSQLSGKAFEMATKILPKNTITLELAQILITDSFSSSIEAHDLFALEGRNLEDYLHDIVLSLQKR
jgi:uncharacterized protein YbjT (DUF2867 family)